MPKPGPKQFVFCRREPELADNLTESGASVLFRMQDVSVSGLSIKGCQADGDGGEVRTGGKLLVEGCSMDRVSLANNSFHSMVLKDVILNGCDLANLETRRLTLVRVALRNCRMTGFRAAEADCRDLLIAEGDQRYAQFRFSKFRSAEFRGCNFEEADFYGSDLTGSLFTRCNLSNAEMSKAKLMDADLRGSQVEGLQLNAQDIRGAVVDASQAMIFAGLLGIRIE